MSVVHDTPLPMDGAAVAEEALPGAPERAPLLGLIEATERHGSVQARLAVTRWPVTVGRDLGADLVLDDVHVAARHLRLEQTAPGSVQVQVQDTANGVMLGHRQHCRGDVFDWSASQTLTIGRLHLRLRLADTPVPPEQPLPRQLWRVTLSSLASLVLVLLLTVLQLWLKINETQDLPRELPLVLSGALGVLLVWSGLWALATKLFSGQPRFWRHVRIASLSFIAANLLDFAAQMLAFAFSWENVGRFAFLLLVFTAAVGIYRHLLVAAPQSRRSLALGVVLVVLLGLPAMLGTQWLKNKRLSNQLYMAQIFPPSWRIAKPVPMAQFLDEAAGIEQRLAKRLQDKQDENGAEAAAGDDE